MKTTVFRFLSLLFFLVIAVNIRALPINELRKKYLLALHDQDQAETVYNLFLKIENPSAKILAYRGALEAIMTKTTWNIFKKLGFLHKSENSFKEAIYKSPNDIEIRFMRLAVQFEIPEYLGFNNNKQEDKAFIISNINRFDASQYPEETIQEIYGFMLKSNYFTKEQVMMFKRYLP